MLPRYFLVRKEQDVIILDLKEDKYLWKENVTLQFAPSGVEVWNGDKAVLLQQPTPTRAGFPPRGADRDWRFEPKLIAQALYYLIASHRMAAKGFPGFAERLNLKLAAEAPGEARSSVSLAQIAGAMEWARLIFPLEAKCLPMAIATARLARRHGIPADVVVGVQALPLAAHAWAQLGDQLINDFLDRVTKFHPIMSLPRGPDEPLPDA